MAKLILLVGILAVSTAPLLIRLSQPTSPITVAFLRVLCASVILWVLALGLCRGPGALGRILTALTRRERSFLVLSGASLGLHFALWIGALHFTSTAAGVALVGTQAIFAGLFGWLTMGEGFRRRELFGVAIALVGTVILAGGDLGGASPRGLLGDGLSLVAAALAAAYLLVGRRLGGALPLIVFLACVNSVAACTLLVPQCLWGQELASIDHSAYWAIAGLVAFPSLIGHSALNHAVRSIPVHLVSLAILAEPIIGTASTYFVVHEDAPPTALFGGALILVGIYVGFRSPSPH